MNVVKMRGGIGNQMFQYAFGKVLAMHTKQVAYDISWYVPHRTETAQHPRPFRLAHFQVTDLFVQDFVSGNALVTEKRVGYNPAVFTLRNENNFDGYWQYLPYYEGIIPRLREEFQLRTDFYTAPFMKMAERIWNTESIGITVRRGDYLLHRKGYTALPARYYFMSIKELRGDLFFFSDDIPWCKSTFSREYFPNRQITFVDMEDYLSFELLRFCKHQIIANGTFGWWAAILNDYCDKVVIRPRHYPGCSEEESDKVRYPKSWIKAEDFVKVFG
jgi:hypothetical protein